MRLKDSRRKQKGGSVVKVAFNANSRFPDPDGHPGKSK